MHDPRLTYLFELYVHNACTDAEHEEFLQLVSDGRNEDQFSELMHELWRESAPKPLASDVTDAILHRILVEKDTQSTRKHERINFRLVTKIAASLLFVLLSGAALFYTTDGDSNIKAPLASTDKAQPRFVKLPDGSTVILNGSSQLHFSSVFDDNVREVTLTGEGFFDIAHDAERPFVVHTGNLRTTVLGTAFNIKAYPDESDIIVTVTRGKVSVGNDRQVFGIVNPDEQITFYKSEETVEQKGVDSHQATSWIEKDIYFDDVTMIEAIDQLGKRFGVRIILENSNAGSCRFTATFVKGEDLSQILRIICDFNNATLEQIEEEKFLIRGGTCSR